MIEPIERDAVWAALKWKCDILSKSYFSQSAWCWIVKMISFSVASVQICSGDRGMKMLCVFIRFKDTLTAGPSGHAPQLKGCFEYDGCR